MIELKCDRCGDNCGLNARVIDIHVVHNPNPVRFGDIGEIRLTDDNARIRYMLCQNCYDKQGLPNPYRTGEKLAEEIKNSGATYTERRGKWERISDDDQDEGWYFCSECKDEYFNLAGNDDDVLPNFCPNCGAKMKGGENNA